LVLNPANVQPSSRVKSGMMRTLLVCVSMAAVAGAATAQEFEVVSVKPNNSGSGSSHSSSNQGRLTAENLALRDLIVMGYNIKDYQLDAPDWIRGQRFDVAAKFPEALPRDPAKYNAELGAMMLKMLVERFKLEVHRETRTLPVYGLVVGKKGIKAEEVKCQGSNSNTNNNHYKSTCTTMARFAEWLSRRMDLPVLDMTGLTANYAMTLEWVQESKASGDGRGATAVNDGPTLRDALGEQLGLRLETHKAPIEVVVVNHVEKVPTEN